VKKIVEKSTFFAK